MKRELLFNKLKIVGLVMYFVILFIERFLAIIFSINHGDYYSLKSGYAFNYVTYSVTVISLIVGVILSVKLVIGLLKSLFLKELYPFEEKYKSIVIAAMAFLYGGMMHTGFTLAPMQFVAYGFLIGSMIVRCVEKCVEDKHKRFESIVSVIYLTLFSMTVPVCYIALELGVTTILFYIVEFLAAFVLIPVFGIMLYQFYKSGITSFLFFYPLLMFSLSGLTVILKWREEINFFVLIFVVLTLTFYFAFGIAASKKK